MTQFYRIKNWQDIYENNRTRGWKNIQWVPIPKRLSGDGYCMIMEDEKGNRRKDGPAIFGTFIAIVELAADCNPRGDLLKSDGTPHTFESIGRICRIIPSLIEITILFCIDPLNWVICIDLTSNCEISAGNCRTTAKCNSILSNSIQCNSLKGVQEGVQGGFEKAKHAKRSIIFVPPTIEEFTKYCEENGFRNIATRAFKSYSEANPPWTDSRGNEIRSWKQKLQNVWFKEENGNQGSGTGKSGLCGAGSKSRAGLPGYDENGNALGAAAKRGEFDEGIITLEGVPDHR
jgi:hypothetical protein